MEENAMNLDHRCSLESESPNVDRIRKMYIEIPSYTQKV